MTITNPTIDLNTNVVKGIISAIITTDITNRCLVATVTNQVTRTIRVNLSLFSSEVAF